MIVSNRFTQNPAVAQQSQNGTVVVVTKYGSTTSVCTQTQITQISVGEYGLDSVEHSPFMMDQDRKASESDLYDRHLTSQFLRSLGNYSAATNAADKPEDEVVVRSAPAPQAKMGTFMGVYLPCIQNIFGVLFFIRLSWIVGVAGAIEGFFVVLICCVVTFLTSISLSAIATNGVVPAGGPYYMISRNLGPEVGGAVGVLFYLGTSVAGSMYIVGAVEIFTFYLVPQAKIFDDVTHCFRLFGTLFLMCIGLIVMAGVRVVNKFALPAVVTVVTCIFLVFIGIVIKFNGTDSLQYCAVGDRMASLVKYMEDNRISQDQISTLQCTNDSLSKLFCNSQNQSFCDPYFTRMRDENKIRMVKAVSGLSNGVINRNAGPKYAKEGQLMTVNGSIDKDPKDSQYSKYYVTVDMATGFFVLVGVFFPSCTGIMAGSNRSGDLQDASRSIPVGTLAATLSTSITYLIGTILFAASIDEMFIRDKFGESAYGRLVIADLAVPHRMVILVGCFLSTIGAGLQSLTGAPRLFQAIAKDEVIPILSPFQASSRFGEPLRAQLLTFAICEVGILIAQLESITALITQFFLMCYCSVNTACVLQSLLNAPGWRPRFKYYHWSLSLIGAILCIAVMFISHWMFALAAIAIGAIVYKYIEVKGAEKEWGDGIRGFGLSAAIYTIRRLDQGPPHTKNWRPQILVLCNMKNGRVRHPRMMALAGQLKAGRGLTVVASVIDGDYQSPEAQERAAQCKVGLQLDIEEQKIKGFSEILVAKNRTEGMSALIQTSGLGGLKHNTVMVSWPTSWAKTHETEGVTQMFVDNVRTTIAKKCALLVLKNVQRFPLMNERLSGTIDVWWVVHDGGLLTLVPFLLKKNRVWRNCKLRIFTVAQLQDNSVQMKKDMEQFLYMARITAEVNVVEMLSTDISDYVYERTLRMEQRSQMLKEMRLSGKEKGMEPQAIVDYHRNKASEDTVRRKLTLIQEMPPITPSPQTEVSTLNEEVTPDGKREPKRLIESFHSAVSEPTSPEGTFRSAAEGEDRNRFPGAKAVSPTTGGHGPIEQLTEPLISSPVSLEVEPQRPAATSRSGAPHVKFNTTTAEIETKRAPPSYFDFVKQSSEDSDQEDSSEVVVPQPGGNNLDSMLESRINQYKSHPNGNQNDLNLMNVRRMGTAVKLNKRILEFSKDAQLVVVNLPGPTKPGFEYNYMEFIEVLTEGLNRVLLVRGSGSEVITIFS